MAGQNYYLMTALPSLGELGSAPPIDPARLLDQARPSAAPHELAAVLFLADDLLQREAALAGEIDEVEPSVLTGPQMRDEEPLPEFLAPPEEPPPDRLPVDFLWQRYYRHAAETADRRGSLFLAAWVAHEVALRNALAAARAEALGLEPDAYFVAPELGDADADFDTVISDWSAAADPLAGLKVLDRVRWEWLDEHDGWFTFANDELAAYAARVMLLHRWHRIYSAGPGPQTPPGGAETELARERIPP